MRVASQACFNPGANFFARKTPIGQKHENTHGELFPQRAGIIRILFFRVWFEARMRLIRMEIRSRGTQDKSERAEVSVQFLQPLRVRGHVHAGPSTRSSHLQAIRTLPSLRIKPDASFSCTCHPTVVVFLVSTL